jgi:hypothetical protein
MRGMGLVPVNPPKVIQSMMGQGLRLDGESNANIARLTDPDGDQGPANIPQSNRRATDQGQDHRRLEDRRDESERRETQIDRDEYSKRDD